MSTPTSRSRWLRGALVGGFSALLAAAAHVSADGAVPSGASLVVLTLACATVGAGAAGVGFERRHTQLLALTAALSAGQFLGHIVLTLTAGHHGHSPVMTAPMLVAHAMAAVGLALLIRLVEHLYVVCATVLCWLRLVSVHRPRPSFRPRPGATATVVRPILLRCGLGMRAPPQVSPVGV